MRGAVGHARQVGQKGQAAQVRPIGVLRRAGLVLLIAIAGTSIIYAAGEAENVQLMVGRSAVVSTATPIARVSLTSPDIADALVTSANELLINGKAPGTISMFVWDRAGAIRRYEIVVQRDLAHLTEQLRDLFPGENVNARSNGKAIVLSGKVSSKTVAENAISVAAGYVEKKDDVVNLLQISESGPSNQVLLRVRFAEVSRSALTELGAGFFTSPLGVKNNIARLTTQQFAAPGYDELKSAKESFDFGSDVTAASGKLTFSDFLNFFLFNEKYDLGMMVRALQTKGLFQSLAEPNLVAESGKEASFLAGGEFPIPVAQASASSLGITVQFKEFGIRLNFTPTVVGDRVHLKVRPEVSALDFNNAIVLQGFRIPALSTRRTETELELQNHQTFAIAGLLNNSMRSSLQKVPGIGDIPILGLLFKSKAAQKEQTELVVMITPEILPRNSQGVTPNLPKMQEPYLPPLPPKRQIQPPPPAFVPQAGNAADAADKVRALIPAAPSTILVQPEARANAAAPNAAPNAAEPAPAVTRPLTEQEKQMLEKARRQEATPKAAESKTSAKEAAAERRRAEETRKIEEKQRKQQEIVAKRQAVADKEAQEVAAKRNAELAKKQAELDKKNQKSIAEAEAKLKAAQDAYEAEKAKAKKQQ